VPCPAPLLGLFPMSQQRFIQEVYRIARERTRAQLEPPRGVPEFSLN
jgi:hypothetical protein